MKLCIATACDKTYQEIGALCEATIRKYAKTFGYDYRVFHERLSDRPAHWDKIRVVQRLFDEGYEYVLWTDSDTLFVQFNRDILEEVEDDKFFYITVLIQRYIDMPGVRLDVDFPSFGFFLIKNTPWSRDLLDDLWNNEKFIELQPRDNGALLEHLGYTFFMDRASKNTFPYSVWRHVKILDPRWNAIKGVPWVPTVSDPILIHYPAQTSPQRLLSMQRDYERLVEKKPLQAVAVIHHDFAEPIDGDGWHVPEQGPEGLVFRWMGLPVTTFRVPLATADYAVSFRALYVLHPETWQMFSLRANDSRITLEVEPAAVGFRYHGVIPEAAITPGEWTTLKFCVDQTRTPREFVEGTPDIRQLGVATADQKISRIPERRFDVGRRLRRAARLISQW